MVEAAAMEEDERWPSLPSLPFVDIADLAALDRDEMVDEGQRLALDMGDAGAGFV
ncbi:hypothetical protein AADZ90_010445 [Aestuariibius sp. 2305UL40-4]|uniref:hypothetical protein n=1 Tax=Aestuariibius violaceus TaxID=3234132 RepID=UPI003476AB1E